MRADLAKGSLTEAHDRLLDVLAAHLVEEFLAELASEDTATADDNRVRQAAWRAT